MKVIFWEMLEMVLYKLMKVLDGGRISIVHYHWELKRALSNCLQYSKEREQFGKPIS